jgi:phage recombination protein Bet
MSNAVAIKPQGRSVLIDMATRFGMEPQAFEATVRATCIQKASREEFAAFLLVAKEYGLNPLTKEIYAFPAKGGGIVPVVSIDGWINLVNSHKACDGFEFDMEHGENGDLISCTCRMFRKDRGRPVTVTEYLSECRRGTEPWKMQHRMLRHKALIQAARYAFGFSGIYDEDEGEKIAEMRDVTPQDEPPAPPPDLMGKARGGIGMSRAIVDQVRTEFSKKTMREGLRAVGRPMRGDFAKRRARRCCVRTEVTHKKHFDHIIPDALGGDTSLTNCAVLCLPCHGSKTQKIDVPMIAKAKRVADKHRGIRKKSRFPGSRDDWRKRKISGEVVRR